MKLKNKSAITAVFFSSVVAVSGCMSSGPAPSKSHWNYVRNSQGECVVTGTWKDGGLNSGCDPGPTVALDAQVEVIEGAPSGLVSTVVIPAAALFPFDNAEFSEEGKKAIEEYRRKLGPELTEAYAGVIIGHTDSTGDPNYNLDLSKRRAESVYDYLVETGTPAEKLRVVGRGQQDPLASNDTKEGRTKNRRVEIIVVGEARALDALRFPSVALFPRRSGELTTQGKQLLEKNREIAGDPLRRATYIEVIGHTDDVGDDVYNQELSEQRATSVRNYLVEAGVDASKIVTVGAGESMPIASNNTERGRAENRRVEILVLGRLK
ncbi:MAG: OmpA family protein [Pseudomonadota bacterium]